ncbi:MAG: DNA-processing protein DprA [Gammaproteobacteria bacterium]|nr:MAG: DNA-processing protein DprA [Gammaproteobacteria bacterium]
MAGVESSRARPHTLACWLALPRLPGLGPRGQLALLQHFTSVENVFSASRSQLEKVLGDKPGAITAALNGPDLKVLERELAWLEEEQDRHHLMTWLDPDYPPLLREIPDPPVMLYVHGDRSLVSCPQLAIVGSRNPTPVGAENAQAFAEALVGAGLTITSGLALGIDGTAHRGALAAHGTTLAVVGTGLDRVYPARHRELAHQIVERGALVSEFPFGTPPRAENFPIRNRLISGLSLGTLVVEAAMQSGSLITARLAAEQGREVFAIPGSIHSPLSRGCHILIRQGAKLVETAQDIVEELGSLARLTAVQDVRDSPALSGEDASHATGDMRSPQPELDPALRDLLTYLGYDPVSVDGLVERSGLTAKAVSSMLLQLELHGHIVACPGGKYLRTS